MLTSEEAEKAKAAGRKVILVRVETSPEDIHGMHAAEGILTARGGMTSHAAVVARGMGKPCVSGFGALRIDQAKGTLSVGKFVLKPGDVITIDGSTGQVLQGKVAMLEPELSGDFAELMGWADEARRLKVRANADTPLDAETARRFGAEGIGLCRTEHMFFDEGRIVAVREMILADDEKGRRGALAKLLPMQRGDFVELFTIMSGLPVTIRLLDPPLHEFLPHTDEEMKEVAAALGTLGRQAAPAGPGAQRIQPHARLSRLPPGDRLSRDRRDAGARHLRGGHRGRGARPARPCRPEIMVPLVMTRMEFDLVKARIDAMASAVAAERRAELSYDVGTMIELPRAALLAGEIAQSAEFFSFGTNDLTQTTLGISRDDAASFLGTYTAKGILAADPFVTLDQDGVGELVRLAAARGREARPGIKLGICGEHGGDPASVAFCERTGLDYVSCSPYRLPIARLAAAQAALGAITATEG